jgi:hypothetical protein
VQGDERLVTARDAEAHPDAALLVDDLEGLRLDHVLLHERTSVQPVRTRLKEPAPESARKKRQRKRQRQRQKARDRRNPGAPAVSRVEAYATASRAVKPDPRVLSHFV